MFIQLSTAKLSLFMMCVWSVFKSLQPQLETVIAICIGLRLNPAISKQLIKIAGYSLSASCESYGIYSLIIDRYYYKGIMWCNDFLIEAGYAPLTRRCEKDSSSECKVRSLFVTGLIVFLIFQAGTFSICIHSSLKRLLFLQFHQLTY